MTEKNSKLNESNKYKHIRLISVALGLLGVVNSVTIGFYLLFVMFNPVFISDLLIQGYILSPIIAIIITMLSYGSLSMLRNNNIKKGARINLVSGLLLASIYLYYAHLSNPLLLNWLSPSGILLIIPALMSGIIGRTTPSN